MLRTAGTLKYLLNDFLPTFSTWRRQQCPGST
jgi:hypothetical protein